MDRYVLVEMNGWKIWRMRSALELGAAQMLPPDPDEQGEGRPPFGSLEPGDQLEVRFEATKLVYER